MKTRFIKELKHYSKKYLLEFLDEKSLGELLKHPILNKNDSLYQFNFVGVIIIDDTVIKCYPKYIPSEKNIEEDFTQTINVIKKYNKLNTEIEYSNDNMEDISFNLLSLMVFFLEDYFENGVYSNTLNVLETNGTGEIDWNRTVNYTNPIIKNNKPYYTNLQTRIKINDLFDYFHLLHEYIITDSSKRLENAGLIDLFDLTPAEISHLELEDFGETSQILEKIEKELNVEFNTQKRKLLSAMHSYISAKNAFTNENYLTVFGTSTYHVIWEDICRRVLNDKLSSEIMGTIKKPEWVLKSGKKHWAKKSFEPDIVTWKDDTFIILDAKYYNLKFDEDNLDANPGLGDITKQYLYQLALEDYIYSHGSTKVKNALLFPKYSGNVENKGYVEIEILKNLYLENIQVVMLPAGVMNKYYLNNKKLSLNKLDLDN